MRGRILLREGMLSHRHRRPTALAGALAALLFALYAAFGYLVAPSLLRSALVERAAEAGFELRFGAIATHPFRLVVDGYDVQLSSAHQRLLYVRHATVDLGWASLWRGRWLVERMTLEAPVLYGFPSLPKQAGKAHASGPPIEVRQLEVTGGRLQLANVPHLEALELSAQGDTFQASAKLAAGGAVRTHGKFSLARLEASGRLELTDAALAQAWRYLPEAAGTAPDGSVSGSFGYRYAGGKLELADATAAARLASGGSLRLSGELALSPFAADLHLEARALPLMLAQPFLHDASQLVLRAGTLSGEGRVRLGERASYVGSALTSDARIDGPEGELLGWRSLGAPELRLQLSPFALHASEIVAQAPRVRVAIGPQGALNLAAAFASKDAPAQAPARASEVAIERLRVEGGTLDFADQSLETPFATTVREVSGALTRLSTTSEEPARVALAGRVGKYGDARVRGTIELAAPTSRTSLMMRLRNLALADFTPYAVKFAGYRIESGRLDAELHYRVRDGRLVGANNLVFDELQLGEKVESASALDLPVDLAVALLTDAEGRIGLAIPVSGNLRDPHFDIGGLIAKALRNTLTKIVSAPFRMLARLFGGKREQPGEVAFGPGSARLSPPAEETLAGLAKALAERPRLALAVRGGYDPRADRKALARAPLLRELAKRAGYDTAAAGGTRPAVDPRDPKIQNAAERLYLARGGQAVELSLLRPLAPGYGRRLLDALGEKTAIAPDALASLARSRAEAVRQALAKSGVDAKRVELAAPTEAQADEDGVPTVLRLETR